MIVTGEELKYSERSLPHCHFIQHRSLAGYPGIEYSAVFQMQADTVS
jgi:hypothetical protein